MADELTLQDAIMGFYNMIEKDDGHTVMTGIVNEGKDDEEAICIVVARGSKAATLKAISDVLTTKEGKN